MESGKKLQTLKTNRDFQAVYGGGRSAANRQLIAYAMRNGLGHNRFGFSVSKKVGNSVTRNKVRRRLKEIVRACRKDEAYAFVPGLDAVFVARAVCAGLPYAQLSASVRHVLLKAGVLRPVKPND